MEAPFQTGSDLLSYHGDPNLAVGSGAVGTPSGFNGQQLGNVLGGLQEHEAQMQLEKYRNKIKDQDDLAKMLSGQDGSVFNMKDPNTGKDLSFSPLPEDQKILTDKAHDLRKIVLSNPEGYKYDQNFLDKQSELRNLQRQASIRAVHVANEQQEMAKSDNDEDRKGIKDNLQQEIFGKKLDEYHRPEPYLPGLKTDESKLVDTKDLYNTSKSVAKDDSDGLWYETSKTTADPSKLDFRNKMLTDKSVANTAHTIVTRFVALAGNNPAIIAQHNQEVAEANARLGLTPNDPHAIPIIPTDPQTGLMAPGFVNSPTSSMDLAYSLVAPKYAMSKTNRVPSEEGLKQKKLQGDIASQGSNIANTDADTALKNAQAIKALRENATGKNGKPSAEELKENLNKQAVKSVYNDVQKLLTPPPNVKPVKLQYFGSDYDVYPIPQGQAHNYIGIESPQTTATTKDKTGTQKETSVKGESRGVDQAFLGINKKTGEKEIAFVDNPYKSNFKIVSTVPEKQLIINKLKADDKYNPSQYENRIIHVDEIYKNKGNTDEEIASASKLTEVNSAAKPKEHIGYNKKITPKGTIYFTDDKGKKYYDDGSGELIPIP